MSSMVRWEPMREMLTMRQLMERLMENAVVPNDRWSAAGPAMDVQMDVTETPDAFEVTVAVPGAEPDELNITFENNTLTIRGEVRQEREIEDETVHLRERRLGAFVRTIMLPGNVRGDAIEARYENGLLRLRIPKAEEAKPRRIEVRDGTSSRQLGSNAGEGQPAVQQAGAGGTESGGARRSGGQAGQEQGAETTTGGGRQSKRS